MSEAKLTPRGESSSWTLAIRRSLQRKLPLAHLLPDRVRQRLVDLADQRHHALIAGIGVVPLLVDVEPRHLGLERHELRAPA